MFRMSSLSLFKDQIANDGFTILENIYSPKEIESIIGMIGIADQANPLFRKTNDLFAIRQFLKQLPEVKEIVFNERLKKLIKDLFEGDYFAVKSIYFDKPERSNWFVAWHQDLTISVDRKIELAGYGPWTIKLNQYSVQPPLNILQNNFTVRIHLDDTDGGNGALKVVGGSHLKGIYRANSMEWQTNAETVCRVNAGGIMIMRPLLMHASSRSITDKRRRVLHIEFSNATLPRLINWSERFDLE